MCTTLVHKFIVVATDGLWNVMSPTEVVNFVCGYIISSQFSVFQLEECWYIAKHVIEEALSRNKQRKLLADNITVVIVNLEKTIDFNYSPTKTKLSVKSDFVVPRRRKLRLEYCYCTTQIVHYLP